MAVAPSRVPTRALHCHSVVSPCTKCRLPSNMRALTTSGCSTQATAVRATLADAQTTLAAAGLAVGQPAIPLSLSLSPSLLQVERGWRSRITVSPTVQAGQLASLWAAADAAGLSEAAAVVFGPAAPGGKQGAAALVGGGGGGEQGASTGLPGRGGWPTLLVLSPRPENVYVSAMAGVERPSEQVRPPAIFPGARHPGGRPTS